MKELTINLSKRMPAFLQPIRQTSSVVCWGVKASMMGLRRRTRKRQCGYQVSVRIEIQCRDQTSSRPNPTRGTISILSPAAHETAELNSTNNGRDAKIFSEAGRSNCKPYHDGSNPSICVAEPASSCSMETISAPQCEPVQRQAISPSYKVIPHARLTACRKEGVHENRH